MNKITPFVFVLVFWGLYYVATKKAYLVDYIIPISIICLLMFVLHCVKLHLKRTINNNYKK